MGSLEWVRRFHEIAQLNTGYAIIFHPFFEVLSYYVKVINTRSESISVVRLLLRHIILGGGIMLLMDKLCFLVED